jgi:hypothetical protein
MRVGREKDKKRCLSVGTSVNLFILNSVVVVTQENPDPWLGLTRISEPRRNPADRRCNGAVHLGSILARAFALQHVDLD